MLLMTKTHFMSSEEEAIAQSPVKKFASEVKLIVFLMFSLIFTIESSYYKSLYWSIQVLANFKAYYRVLRWRS